MYNMIEGFKHRINELKHNCIKLYKKNGKLKRIIDNSKAKYSISRKKRFYKTKNNKKYENILICNLRRKGTFIINFDFFFLVHISRPCQRRRNVL